MSRYALILCLAVALAARAQEEPARPPEPKRARPPLTEEQRAQLEQRLDDTWQKLPLGAKQRLLRLHRALNQMPPEERQFIHDRIERFLTMSPEERDRLRRNRERWNQMSPEQRQEARERYLKWRAEHPGQEPPLFRPQPPPPPPPPPPPNDNPEPGTDNQPKETP
jgi:hypothetical protein